MSVQSIQVGLKRPSKMQFWSSGLALFSMFFGAGNIVFPLIIGQVVQKELIFAWMGLAITAVIVPILGVISTALFEGNYERYFKRLGTIPGWLIILLLFGLVGPFAGIPRLVSLCYASLKVYFPHMNLYIFSGFSCLLIFLLTFKKNNILQILGTVLTPILLGSLFVIIVKGVFFARQGVSSIVSKMGVFKAFSFGLLQGYNTLDLLASFFFSSLICNRLKGSSGNLSSKGLLLAMVKISTIGASLLAFVYLGFGAVAAKNSALLEHIPKDQLLGAVGQIILGPYAGFVISLAIIFSCLTTAIALTTLCADFLRERLPMKRKLPYETCLIVILCVTGLISSLEFSGIVSFLAPILSVCYPALMVLCFMNILHKIYNIQMVKVPVFGVFFLALLLSHGQRVLGLFL